MTPLHILIVDQNASHREFLRKFLEPLQAEITEASDENEGLNLALSSKFDLITTDVTSEKLNGIHLCKCLKSTAFTRGIPVIMVSSFNSNDDIERGFQAGASAYIPKNEARTTLYDIVKKILSRSKFKQERLIMVVEDSHSISKMVEYGLLNAGFQVITAENGKKALQLLASHKPDLILSDINMPEMNGFAFCEAVHTDSKLSSIPFVVMSTRSDRLGMQRMLQYGAASYIVKPFNMDQLVILVEKILSDQFLLLLKEKERLDTEQKLMLASIMSLISALEARDPYTKGHSEQVGSIISAMVSIAGESQRSIERAGIGGKLHDIGKIGIRDSILLKPGKLNDEEYEQIKQHPVIGANILKPIPSLSDIIDIVLSHHERFDGKGYPQGLKGNQISKWARIAAVADTYDALTTCRPYRDGMKRGKAIQIISDVRGTQLCPESVNLFLEWIKLSTA
ncbi:putative two-component system response regulator [Candidatus Magnetomoraceae bacterium gMMP-15]